MSFGSLKQNFDALLLFFLPMTAPNFFRTAWFPTTIGLVLLLLVTGCNSDKPQYVRAFTDRGKVPVMYTDSVTTLISDSGRIRYRVVSEVWKVYDKAAEPCWYFPKKVYFERFNDGMKTESLVQCDTAWYFTRLRKWELRKHVTLVNLKGERFETAQLFWDQRAQRIYSDSFIRIEQQDQILTGYGFESDERLIKYRIHKPTGVFPVDRESESEQ
jgi:LPS export ABC transporter protein LptC